MLAFSVMLSLKILMVCHLIITAEEFRIIASYPSKAGFRSHLNWGREIYKKTCAYRENSDQNAARIESRMSYAIPTESCQDWSDCAHAPIELSSLGVVVF